MTSLHLPRPGPRPWPLGSARARARYSLGSQWTYWGLWWMPKTETQPCSNEIQAISFSTGRSWVEKHVKPFTHNSCKHTKRLKRIFRRLVWIKTCSESFMKQVDPSVLRRGSRRDETFDHVNRQFNHSMPVGIHWLTYSMPIGIFKCCSAVHEQVSVVPFYSYTRTLVLPSI